MIAPAATAFPHARGWPQGCLADAAAFDAVRAATLRLCEPLEIEDYGVQSMPDASPAKWHLGHTTWFFECFVLQPHLHGYRAFDPAYGYLFNSYYDAVGPRQPRAERGLLSRPTLADVLRYRACVDAAMARLLAERDLAPELLSRVEVGLQHEQQHQELLLTDIKHAFSLNPLRPAYAARRPGEAAPAVATAYLRFPSGLYETGAGSDGFAFDNERPRHRVYLEPFELASRLVTNAEYLEFVRDGGYRQASLWLSDGWLHRTTQGWTQPLYWSEGLDAEFTLAGEEPLDPRRPVCHLSYYEADAYARWAGARLPTEFEWEIAVLQAGATPAPTTPDALHPAPADGQPGLQQVFGATWQWTASAHAPYPGYRPAAGALGEYNGKFMVNQQVLRGSSCATPPGHARASYRNFFHPWQRWQFSGVRLARGI